MDHDTISSQANSADETINQTTEKTANVSHSPIQKKNLLIFSIIAALLIIGYLFKIITKQNTSISELSNIESPIIMSNGNQFIAIDPNKNTNNVLFPGGSSSFKLSPDRKRIAYKVSGSNKCEELAITSIDKKETLKIEYAQDCHCRQSSSSCTLYGWVDSSTLVFMINSHKPYGDDRELYLYDDITKKSKLLSTISIDDPWKRLSIRSNNIYFTSQNDTNSMHKSLNYVNLKNPTKVEKMFDYEQDKATGSSEFISISPDEKYAVIINQNAEFTKNPIVFRSLVNGKIIKSFMDMSMIKGWCAGNKIIFSPDSKKVAICAASSKVNPLDIFNFMQNHEAHYKIFDMAGNKIAEVGGNKLNKLIHNLIHDKRIKSNGIREFIFSPDSRKIFFISSPAYNGRPGDIGMEYSYGRYAFIGDADGNNLKRVPFPGDGLNSYSGSAPKIDW